MKDPFMRGRINARYVLMMISAKGGVGKSTVTVNLAAALTARGKKVGIFDADLHGPNIPALLGIRQKSDLSNAKHPEAMFPIAARPDAMDMRPMPPYQRYGIGIMSLGLMVGEGQTITPQSENIGPILTSMLARVDWDADILLIDMPPGTGEPLHSLLSMGLVDGAVMIAVRERLAHLDNGRLVTMLHRQQVPILGVVENMTHIICPRCGELIELYPAPVEQESGYQNAPVLASVPFHPHLIRQVQGGAPLALREADEGEAPVRDVLLSLADQVIARVDEARANPPAPLADRPSPDDDCIDCP